MLSSGLLSPDMKQPSWQCAITASLNRRCKQQVAELLPRHSWKHPRVIVYLQLFMWNGKFPCSLSLLFLFGCHILINSKTSQSSHCGPSVPLFLAKPQKGKLPSGGLWHTSHMSATQCSGFILLSHLSCSLAILFTKRGRPGRRDSQQGEIREGLLGKFHLHTNASLGVGCSSNR